MLIQGVLTHNSIIGENNIYNIYFHYLQILNLQRAEEIAAVRREESKPGLLQSRPNETHQFKIRTVPYFTILLPVKNAETDDNDLEENLE